MSSNHAKGKQKEREFLKWIDREGYVIPYSNFGEKDIFGIADGLFLGSGGGVVFFQITHRCAVKRHRKAIDAFVDAHPNRDYAICLYSYGHSLKRFPAPFRQVKVW